MRRGGSGMQNERTAMSTNEIRVGSATFWLTWKLATILIFVVLLAVASTSPDFSRAPRIVFVGLIVLIMVVSNEELVYGHAAEDGIHYRRYLKSQFAPWELVESIHWGSSDRISFRLNEGFLFRKVLSAQSFTVRSRDQWLSEPPEVVRWLLVSRPAGSEGIELKGPGL